MLTGHLGRRCIIW